MNCKGTLKTSVTFKGYLPTAIFVPVTKHKLYIIAAKIQFIFEVFVLNSKNIAIHISSLHRIISLSFCSFLVQWSMLRSIKLSVSDIVVQQNNVTLL